MLLLGVLKKPLNVIENCNFFNSRQSLRDCLLIAFAGASVLAAS
jgi:hypothetical protein